MLNEEAYFAVSSGEDGTRIEQLSKDQLLDRLNSNYYGTNTLDKVPAQDKGCFTGCGEDPLLIIKGQIVQPRVVRTVVEVDID